MIPGRTIIKECIFEAYLQLLEEQKSDSISITEITERAGVSRVSYYRNYSSKFDIIEDYLKDYVNYYYKSNNIIIENIDFNQNLYHTLEICRNNKRLFKLLFEVGVQLKNIKTISEKTYNQVSSKYHNLS